MIPVPWRYVNMWYCDGCGLCCREFDVVLRFDEWLRIIRRYGVGVTRAGLNKFYLRRKGDGSCIFLYEAFGRQLCGLQDMKPIACKLWPFKIYTRPKYGRAREAVFNYEGQRLFVYIDPSCPRIVWGEPSQTLIYKIIPEFIEIAIGVRKKQFYSTSRWLYNLSPKLKPRRLI